MGKREHVTTRTLTSSHGKTRTYYNTNINCFTWENENILQYEH